MREGDQAGNLCCLNAELSGRLDNGPVAACFLTISDTFKKLTKETTGMTTSGSYFITSTVGRFSQHPMRLNL